MQTVLLDCPRTGPDKWAIVTLWDENDDSARLEKHFDSLSEAHDYAHDLGPFLRAGCKVTIKHGENITYTIEES